MEGGKKSRAGGTLRKKKKKEGKGGGGPSASKKGSLPLPACPPAPRVDLTQTLFVRALPPSLLCPLHLGLLEDPVIGVCGHSFCTRCLRPRSQGPFPCPLDSTDLSSGGWIPNLALVGQVNDLLVYCKYGVKQGENGELEVQQGGCTEQIRLAERDVHEAECAHAPAPCPHCNIVLLRTQLEQHLMHCAHLPCPLRRVGCTWEGDKSALEDHLSKCAYAAIQGFVNYCDAKIQDLENQIHVERQEKRRLTDSVAHLLARISALEAKNVHYDATLLRWNQGQLVKSASAAPVSSLRPLAAPRSPIVVDIAPQDSDVDTHSFKCKATFIGHDGPVWTLAVAKSIQASEGGLLISGSSDQTIRVWDMDTHKIRHTLTGHDGIVHAVIVVGKKIISGSSDKTIKVWNMKSFKCERTITGHGHTICKLVVSGNLLFSGSYTEIKVWDMKSFECLQTLKGHNHWVRALCVDKGVLYSGCHNLIKMWDISTFKCIKDITGHYGSIYSVVVVDEYLLAGTYENAIMVFDVTTGQRMKELAGHCGAVYAVCTLDGKRVFSGSYDSTIKVWALDRDNCVQTLKRHTSSVEALICDGDSVFSASSDNSIKVFS